MAIRQPMTMTGEVEGHHPLSTSLIFTNRTDCQGAYGPRLSFIKKHDQVFRLARGGDDVDFAVAVQVGDFDVFDGDFF